MATPAAPLTVGATIPPLDLTAADGFPTDVAALTPATGRIAIYLMRTPTCPVCHQHLRQIERLVGDGMLRAEQVIVVTPGAPGDAAAVSRRHALLASRIVASETAHATLGLFVRHGLQQSGTLVVAAGQIVMARHATVPLGAFDAEETLVALRS